MEFGISVTIPDLSKWDKKFILGQLHAAAGEIATEILHRIEDRTPVLTGALKEDETYTLAGTGPGYTPVGSPLVSWYLESEYQDAEWHRYYGPYQEGGALGLSTYTNGPHEMFARVATDDLPLIEEWAKKVVADAVQQIEDSTPVSTMEL
jgi:hypothetical protein